MIGAWGGGTWAGVALGDANEKGTIMNANSAHKPLDCTGMSPTQAREARDAALTARMARAACSPPKADAKPNAKIARKAEKKARRRAERAAIAEATGKSMAEVKALLSGGKKGKRGKTPRAAVASASTLRPVVAVVTDEVAAKAMAAGVTPEAYAAAAQELAASTTNTMRVIG